MEKKRIKISTQASDENWAMIKKIAQEEGRKDSSVVDEAFSMLIEDRRASAMPREHVMKAFKKSTKKYDALYRLLAK